MNWRLYLIPIYRLHPVFSCANHYHHETRDNFNCNWYTIYWFLLKKKEGQEEQLRFEGKNGRILIGREEIGQRWTEYSEELFTLCCMNSVFEIYIKKGFYRLLTDHKKFFQWSLLIFKSKFWPNVAHWLCSKGLNLKRERWQFYSIAIEPRKS